MARARKSRSLISLLILMTGIFVASQARAVPAPGKPNAPIRSVNTTDVSKRIDANLVSMFVTNIGSFAWDLATQNSGLEFPRGSGKTAVFAAGIWLGARVAGETRVTVAEYSQEFIPGPMAGGTFLPDSPDYRVYKASRNDTTGYADWMARAVPLGAPTDPTGTMPGIIGDQTLWTVFNDADPGSHSNSAGNSPPLGVEVQLLAFAYDRPGALGHTIYLRYRLINKGANTLNDTYVSLWADPDLGGAGDDFVGVDVPAGLGYCYNAVAIDNVYGSTPPAVGFDLLQGPRADGGGRLALTSFNMYINGTDPRSPIESYNYMRGLSKGGDPIVNPVTGLVTTFVNDGDPCTGSGWLDSNPSDRRLMMSAGPFTFAPGETQEVVAAVVLGQGSNYHTSIGAMQCNDDVAQLLFDRAFDESALPPEPRCPDCDPTTRTQISLVDADVEDGRVTLVWYAGADEGAAIALERREGEGEWANLGPIAPDAAGRIVYEDSNVRPGGRYGYRLGLSTGAGSAEYFGETWVNVPGLSLAIAGLWPNPGSGSLSVRITLPEAGAARITVTDVAGRLALSHDASGLGAGAHRVDLAAERKLAPGVYVVRLVQGAQHAEAKAVVTP